MKKRTVVHIGCSGYYNRHWKEIFYPPKLPQRSWFEFYCENFDTVELNSTFYKFPTEESLQTWYHKSPAGFLFSVKAPKLITHFKSFNDCSRLLDDFYLACEQGLLDKLGCILFQLPPSIKYSEQKLEQIITSLRPGFSNVVEFRNSSWWIPEVFNVLSEHQITFCTVSHPTMPTSFISNTHIVYVRYHGVPDMFYSNYSADQLQKLHKSILQSRGVKKAFVYFNNTAGEAGVLNALQLNNMFQQSTLENSKGAEKIEKTI